MFDRRRPDVSQGVFETLLVRDGHPIDLDAHLSRLRASLAELYPNQAIPVFEGAEAPESDCAMRIDVAPRAARLEIETSFREIGQPSQRTALHSLSIAGGLGEHKWVDRSLLDEAQAGLPGDALPLIVDSDGAVLEASRANVFVVHDGALHTPPLDGRILPGITRARLIERAAAAAVPVRERALSRDDLLAADEVFLTGSVRGIEPAGSLDGIALGDERHVSDALR